MPRQSAVVPGVQSLFPPLQSSFCCYCCTLAMGPAQSVGLSYRTFVGAVVFCRAAQERYEARDISTRNGDYISTYQ